MKTEILVCTVCLVAGLTLVGCSVHSGRSPQFRVAVADPADVHAKLVMLNGERLKLSDLADTLRSLGAAKETPITLNPRSVVSYGGDALVDMTLRQAGYTNVVWQRYQDDATQNKADAGDGK